MNYQHSLSGSSVRSYRQLESPRQPPAGLVKHLHTHTHLDQEQPEVAPLAPNRSSEVLSRALERGREEAGQSQRFCESVGSCSQQKYTQ